MPNVQPIPEDLQTLVSPPTGSHVLAVFHDWALIRYVGQPIGEYAEHVRTKYSAILLAIVTETEAMRLEDILSTDFSAIDMFIKRKFEESGKDFFTSEKKRVAVQLNPPQDYAITKNDSAIVLGKSRPGEGSLLEKSLDLVR